MPRGTQPNRLNLWMNGLPVGYWETTRSGERLAYRDDWIDHPQANRADVIQTCLVIMRAGLDRLRRQHRLEQLAPPVAAPPPRRTRARS